MDDTAALEINGKDYETVENLCDNEENEVVVAFSTKDIGGKTKCNPDKCEGKCTEAGECEPCPEGTTWDNGECTCPSGKHWNEELRACAACGDNSHCTSSNKPACNAEGNCDTCKNVYPEKPNWSGSECVSECPEDKPISYNNQCVECRTNSDCDKKEDGKHYWCDTNMNNGTCTPCSEWDEAKQLCKIGECESNDDCEEGEYCWLYYAYSCTQEFQSNKFGLGNSDGYKGKCKKAESDINKKGDINSKYIMSTNSMTWWSAERFCKALNKHMVAISELQCKHNIQYSGGDCPYGYCHASDTEQECGTQNKREGESYYSDVSEVIKALRKANDGKENSTVSKYLWLKDAYDTDPNNENSCSAYYVNPNRGHVGYYSRNYDVTLYALCE